jgi:hypothetical protein
VFHLHWVQLSTLCYLYSEKSGHGILEFSTDKAGQDVTPLNLEFGEEDKAQHKSSSGALNSITGIFCTTQLIMWHVFTLLMEAKHYCIGVSVFFASLQNLHLKVLSHAYTGRSLYKLININVQTDVLFLPHCLCFVRFEVFTAVSTTIMVLTHVMQCSTA